MVDTHPTIFRLFHRSAHRLTDIMALINADIYDRHFSSFPFGRSRSTVRPNRCFSRRSPGYFLRSSSVDPRSLRFPSTFPSSSSGRNACRSLVTVRTYYSFGARSMRSVDSIPMWSTRNLIENSAKIESQRPSCYKARLFVPTTSFFPTPPTISSRPFVDSSPISVSSTSVINSSRSNPVSPDSLPLELNISHPKSVELAAKIEPTINDDLKSVNHSDADWESLKDKNKALEKEIEQLKRELKIKESLECNLKRDARDLETKLKISEQKCDQFQKCTPQVIHIREPGEPMAISQELVGQLNNAANKLVKMDTLGDMAKLQRAMDNALKEIAT